MSDHDQLAQVQQTAREWMAWDPDPGTVARTRAMLADPEEGPAELRACFGRTLPFGTAGIRGLLGPGPGRMNRALVMKVTAGLADYLGRTVDGARERGVVVGHDARRGSAEFARDTAEVLAAAGFRVIRCPPQVPTPLVAFALRELSAACGVVITASHNPPAYNGYKVYWENGAQIVPPIDAGIAAAIDAVRGPVPTSTDGVQDAPAGLFERYLTAIAEQVEHLPVVPGEPPQVVYTPLHGVGAALSEPALERQGLQLHVVAAQREPDGEFPTVSFPNPEEPGALDLADAVAERAEADLILAHDPDADRLSVTLRADGALRRLSGDELGVLLGDALLEARGHERNRAEKAFVARSIVSSDLLGRVAEHHGAACYETLTGFKWLWNRSLEAEARGETFVMAYEEALGYSVGPVVRDKDGIGAALAVARIARSGRTLWERLCAIWERHGHVATRQKSLVDATPGGLERLAARVAALRESLPAAVDGSAVARTRDYAPGGDLPPANCLALWLDDGSRVMLRPSGTEPKLKIYLQVRSPWSNRAHEVAQDRLEALEHGVVKLVLRA